MGSTNYKAMLADRTAQEFSNWQAQQHVQEREIYRFLHTMKGTAGTIGLMDLSEYCGRQLESFGEDSTELLPVQSLNPLMETFTAFLISEEKVPKAADLPSREATVKESFVLVIDEDAMF